MHNRALIGILAGMGPKSTGPFIDQVISSFQSLTGAKNDIDFPPIMIYSLPTPFYLDRPIDHKFMEKTICEGLKKLEACGVSFIAMPCNTAHLYFEVLEKCIRVPLLNMIDLTLNSVPRSVKKIAILGTRPTLDSQIFQRKLQQANLEYAPYLQWQEKVDSLILAIKTDGESQRTLKLWADLSGELLKEGVDTILLVCTDLNVIFRRTAIPFQVVDSAACLAEGIVSYWQNESSKNI